MTQKLIKPKSKTRGRYAGTTGLAAKVALVANSGKSGKMPDFVPGDTVKVHVRIKEGAKERIQVFEGVCMKKKRGSDGIGSFTVRKISHGVGVERIFLDSSPKLAKIEKVQSGKVARAKLYYLRELEGKAAKLDRVQETDNKRKAAAPAAPVEVSPEAAAAKAEKKAAKAKKPAAKK